MNRKIVIALNTTWNLVNFRAGLIRALVADGYEVVAVAPPDEHVPRLMSLGCRYVPLHMDNMGTHPGHDLLLFWRFYRLLRRERPAVFLGYTIKPNIYGSIAAHALNIPVINNIAGLGTVFGRNNWLTSLVRKLYRLALSKSARVFFQNEEDRRHFIESGLVRAEITDRVPGSGVDVSWFTPTPLPTATDEVHFLLIARLLWDKGVGEFIAAARTIRSSHPYARFSLLGFLDVQNPAAISRAQIEAWAEDGIVTYLGSSDDVRPHISAADCIVLPSYYREGVPRTLLEAAAMARPIITTDAVGCRDVVIDGVSGWLCRPRDPHDLALKMALVIAQPPIKRTEMGQRGRNKILQQFDEKIVVDKYLSAIRLIGL